MNRVSITKFLSVACLLLGASFASLTQAMPIQLEATINGAQANAGAGSGSAATGFATMTYDEASMLFSWDIEWSGLSGPAFAAHFHGPASPTQNALVEINIGAASPAMGSANLSMTQGDALLAGLWYINIHTIQNPGGEIRGQVLRAGTPVPLPSSLALVLLAAAGYFSQRKARR